MFFKNVSLLSNILDCDDAHAPILFLYGRDLKYSSASLGETSSTLS